MKVEFCPKCTGTKVKRFEFGEFWCSSCHAWFTKTEVEAKIRQGFKVDVKKKLEH